MRVPNEEILQALLNDSRFAFKDRSSKYLTSGHCPQCGDKSLWVRKDKPFYLNCNHKNSCGYEGTVKDEIPELFTGWEERFPATAEEPDRTANTYLTMDRGFDLSKIWGWYSQEACRLDDGQYCATVRFYLDDARTRYWERLIGRTWEDGRRAHFGGKRKADGTLYAGDAWTPPGQELAQGERCYIVEGIFHAIALYMTGRKVAAAFSCTNLPSNLIKEHKGKGIRWAIALDGDKAGRKYAKRHARKIRAMEEKAEVCMLPNNGQDWDDLFRAGKISDDFVSECLHWGRVFMSRTVEESAYHRYCRKPRESQIFDFENKVYEVKVPTTPLHDDLAQQEVGLESTEGYSVFLANCSVELVCNVFPECLYREVDEIVDERWYVFRINYENLPPAIVRFDGADLTSPSSFNAALIDKTAGGAWMGNAGHFKYMSLKWLSKAQHCLVKSVPYQGYVKEVGAYIFEDRAFHRGKEIKVNSEGLFRVGKMGIKTNLSMSAITMEGAFSSDWIEDYVRAFSMSGLAVLSFWLGSFFVQQIRKEQSSFPFLEFTGEPGAGKSTVLEFLWKCSGRMDCEGFDVLKATPAGQRRAYNQLSGLPVVLIESDRDNGEPQAKVKQFDFDNLKAFYNGRGTGTLGVAKRGNDVEENPFRGSLIISQNAEVDGSQALLQRIVHCHADKKHHGPGTREIARWFERQTPETVGGFIKEALKNESAILKRYFECFDMMEARFTPHLRSERVCKNHAQVAACACAQEPRAGCGLCVCAADSLSGAVGFSCGGVHWVHAGAGQGAGDSP